MIQLPPSMQYATGNHRVPIFLGVKGCIHYFVFAFVRADMTSPREDKDLFMLCSLTAKKTLKSEILILCIPHSTVLAH